MKKSLAFLLCMILGLGTVQTFGAVKPEVEEKKEVEEKIYVNVEQSAQFPGGVEALYKYLEKELNAPGNDDDSGFGIQGKLICSFVVEKDGSIKQVKIEEGFAKSYDEAVVKTLKDSPKWTPAVKGGKIVRQKMSMPVYIKL